MWRMDEIGPYLPISLIYVCSIVVKSFGSVNIFVYSKFFVQKNDNTCNYFPTQSYIKTFHINTLYHSLR